MSLSFGMAPCLQRSAEGQQHTSAAGSPGGSIAKMIRLEADVQVRIGTRSNYVIFIFY